MTPARDDRQPDIQAALRTMQGQLETMLSFMGTLATKEDVQQLDTRVQQLDTRVQHVEGRMSRLEVLFEQLRHDVLGSLKDLRTNDVIIENHEQRMQRVEHHLHLAA